MEDHVKKARSTGTRRFNRAKGIPHKAWDYGRKDTLRRGERVGSLGAEYFKDTRAEVKANEGKWYDFGQSRKEKYVGPGTGSIITTPNTRKGYTKGGSPRMKIPEKATTKWVSGNVHGDTYETQHPSVKMRTTGEVVVPRHKEISRHPFVMRTQGGRNIPKDKWEREKYWGTYNEVSRTYK